MFLNEIQPLELVVIKALLVVVLFFLFVFYFYTRKRLALLEKQHSESLLLIKGSQENATLEYERLVIKTQHMQQAVTENEQVTKQLEHRISVLHDKNEKLLNKLEHIQAQEPEDKLYSRASKLVALGADINEIMQECDIPKAEAEMLLSIHKNKQ